MCDEIDRQIVRDQKFLDAAIAYRKPEGPKANGFCLFCREPIKEPGQRWCDADCRDSYELATNPPRR